MPPSKPSRRAACFYVGDEYDVGESVGHLLYQLMVAMRREVESRMAELGVTDAQWKPLWLLRDGRADTALELARLMSVDAGAVTRMVDRLEAKGLVERVRSETDRRVVHLRLTREGDATAEQIPHVLAQVNNDFLRGFTKAEFGQVKEFLQRMLATGQELHAQDESENAA